MPRRLRIRTRLTLSYAGLVTGLGAVLIAIVYFFMRFVPTYRVVGAMVGPMPTPTDMQPARAVEITSADDFLHLFLIASIAALVLLAALGGAVGWIVAGRIIRPLAAINAAATRAATGALDHRVGLDGPRDEIRDLSTTFDRMLASLERSFATHRRFAANASHELRTPLATTQTMIDVVLADPDASAAELRALAGRVREVNRSNIEAVDALLDLADAGTGELAHEPVNLSDVTDAVLRELSAEATTAGVELPARTGEAATLGDPVLVRQAVANLVRNAVRHNRRGGHATVRLSMRDETARVTIANTGAPVPPDAVEALVEPFVRGTGRTITRGSGHGLGLAIVSAITTAHDGTLALHPNPDGGLTVHLDLPRAEAER
jgi:two-component system, OmpR family, sensor histidine kinase VanS